MSGDGRSPCWYAAQNGFNTGADGTTVDFPGSVAGVCQAPGSPACSFLRVTVQRSVPLSFMRIAGFTNWTIHAAATAAITYVPSAVPIIVTHPHLKDSFSTNGTPTLTVTGGPPRSIEIDSDGTIDGKGQTVSPPEAFSVNRNATVDLSKAGPKGTGADYVSVAPGGTGSPPFSWLKLGTTGNYVQPASPTWDPFASLNQPTTAGLLKDPKPSTVTSGKPIPGCNASCSTNSCTVYQPGYYHTSGINVSGSGGKNQTIAYFNPGLYYIDNPNGFSTGSNGDLRMVSDPTCGSTATDPDTNDGMVVFLTGLGNFSVGSNGSAYLKGPPVTSTKYEGVLFWQDRDLTCNGSGPGQQNSNCTASFGGGGNLTLLGTIYVNQEAGFNLTYSNYRYISLKGNSGSTTTITGEIITNALSLGGNSGITMNLSLAQLANQQQVALVQ